MEHFGKRVKIQNEHVPFLDRKRVFWILSFQTRSHSSYLHNVVWTFPLESSLSKCAILRLGNRARHLGRIVTMDRVRRFLVAKNPWLGWGTERVYLSSKQRTGAGGKGLQGEKARPPRGLEVCLSWGNAWIYFLAAGKRAVSTPRSRFDSRWRVHQGHPRYLHLYEVCATSPPVSSRNTRFRSSLSSGDPVTRFEQSLQGLCVPLFLRLSCSTSRYGMKCFLPSFIPIYADCLSAF